MPVIADARKLTDSLTDPNGSFQQTLKAGQDVVSKMPAIAEKTGEVVDQTKQAVKTIENGATATLQRATPHHRGRGAGSAGSDRKGAAGRGDLAEGQRRSAGHGGTGFRKTARRARPGSGRGDADEPDGEQRTPDLADQHADRHAHHAAVAADRQHRRPSAARRSALSRARRLIACGLCAAGAALLGACSSPPVRSPAEIQTQGFSTQGIDRFKAGDLPRALAFFQQALVIAQSIEDDDAIAAARLNLSMVYVGMGRQDEALKQLDLVLDERRLVFSADRRAEAALRRAMAVQASDRASAEQSLDRAAAICGSGCSVKGKILNLKAYIALSAGRTEEGLKLAQQAQSALAKDDALEKANALRLQSSAYIALKTPAAAVPPAPGSAEDGQGRGSEREDLPGSASSGASVRGQAGTGPGLLGKGP